MARHKVSAGQTSLLDPRPLPPTPPTALPTKLLPRDPTTIARAKDTLDEVIIRICDPLLTRAYLEELIGEAEARLESLGFPYPRA